MMIKAVFGYVAILLVVTIGCTGTMDGVIRRDAKRIQIFYTDSRTPVAELVTVLPGGERFRGKPERLDTTKEMMEAGSSETVEDFGRFEEVQAFSGNLKATLSGNKGNTMQCRFELTDVIIGFSSGGFGLCQLADDRVIDVFF
jgi:hypothetical protein